MNRRYALLALMVSAIVALSMVATVGTNVVLADSNENEDAGRGHIGSVFDEHFNLGMVENEGNSVAFLSSSEKVVNGTTTKTLFGFFASAEDAPTLAVALLNITSSRSDEGRNASFTWAVGGIKVLGVFEYNDSAHTGLYNRSVDGQPLSQVDFEDMAWTLNSKQVTSSSGAQGYMVNITGTKGTFVFSVSAVIYNTGVVVAGTKLSPTEAKVNFTIENYPYVSNTSRLGLLVSYGGQQHFGTVTSIIMKSTSGSGEDEVETVNKQTTATISKGAFAYFTWAGSALIDGQSKPVLSQQLRNGTFAKIILNYPHGNTILHDPILGAGTGTANQIPSYIPAITSASSLNLYLIAGSIAIIVLISALAIAARRKLIEPRLMM